MKKILLSAASIGCAALTFGQNLPEKCITNHLIEHRDNQLPGYAQSVEETFERAKLLQDYSRDDTVYTIPVVVHVVWNIAEEDLPDSVIHEQILSLNEDYRRTNPDTVNMRSDFETIVGDSKIQFELAQVDPMGNPTTGITRTETTITEFGSFNVLFGDMSDFERIKSTANGGIDPWNQSKYLNIWVGDLSINGIQAVLGYATPPDGLSHWPAGSVAGMSDGVVIQYQAFGRNNPNPLADPNGGGGNMDVRGRTVTHEVGHYLGLRHIWGDGDCNEQDGIDDTPNADAQSNFDCDQVANTCVDNIGSLGDLPNMVENYMDYSAETCQNSYTDGQIAMIRSILQNERYELVHNNDVLKVNNEEKVSGSIYPNPGSDIVQISFGANEAFVVDMIDITGKSVLTSDNPKQINVSALEGGVYILQLKSKDGILLGTKQFVKQ